MRVLKGGIGVRDLTGLKQPIWTIKTMEGVTYLLDSEQKVLNLLTKERVALNIKLHNNPYTLYFGDDGEITGSQGRAMFDQAVNARYLREALNRD